MAVRSPFLAICTLFALPAVSCTPGAAGDPELGHVAGPAEQALRRAEEIAYAYLEDPELRLLGGVEALWTESIHIDPRGTAHTRVIQTVANVPVFAGEAIVHSDARASSMTDSLVRYIDVDTTPRLTDMQAVDLAVLSRGGWERVSELPAADLQIVRRPDRDHLTYRVRLRQFVPGYPPAMPVVFIDAHSGEVVWHYDDLKTYTLKDGNKATYDMHQGTDYGAATFGDSSDDELLTTHNAIQGVLDFWQSRYGRDSYDGAGAHVKAYGHYGSNYSNAFWDGARLSFGDGDGVVLSYLGVRDIVAHELGHALTDSEANFTYYGEPGALSESASDMLAAAAEAYMDGGVKGWNFDIGEDCWLTAGEAIRYMSHPSDDGSSRDHYSNRYTGKADNGGVHYNSGIANHWFYLLSQGGRHHNPAYRSGYTIEGLGITNAYNIWYHALTNYMTSSTSFASARAATEAACANLGYSSGACTMVSLAWYEVGVGSNPYSL